jgi:nitrogen-specific signal transduction histidine kinase
MSENRTGEPEIGDSEMLFICDVDGRVQAVSSAAALKGLLNGSPVQKHFTEVFGAGSEISGWLAEHIDEARNHEQYRMESRLEHNGERMTIMLESLKHAEALYAFAIQVKPHSCGEAQAEVAEGDAVVTRQQWHDIKNQLGGLKLYATFLNRKLPPSEDRQTVERMLNGINVLIEHLAKIRRGESQ